MTEILLGSGEMHKKQGVFVPKQAIEYGKYTIKAGLLSGVWTARAFYKSSSAPKGIVRECSGNTEGEAIAALKAELDDDARTQRGNRRRDNSQNFDIPTVREYSEALRVSNLSPLHVEMLKAHASAGDDGLTTGELALAAGYSDYSAANLQYGICARLLGDVMDVSAPDSTIRDADVATGILATIGNPRASGEFVWVMHRELREAVTDILA